MNHAVMDKAMLVLGCMWLMACGSDPARFRPAKGAGSFPAAKTAYRVEAPSDGCEAIGVVIEADSIDDIASTAANHGGTHYRVLDDFGGTSIETTGSATHVGWGNYVGRSTSREVKRHWYTAQVYRCP